jgi:hypothetical protein
MALMTGGSPRTMGVNYDVAYDRALNPPDNDLGQRKSRRDLHRGWNSIWHHDGI